MEHTDRSLMRRFAILGVIAIVVPLLALAAGRAGTSIADVLAILCGGGETVDRLVVLELRLPRVLVALLVGAGLAVAGTILQGVCRNPLAEPGTLGLTGGAGLGVVMLLLYDPHAATRAPMLASCAAFGGCTCAMAATFALTWGEGGLRPSRLLLVGLSLGLGLSGALLLLPLRMSPEIYNYTLDWITGTLITAEISQAVFLAPCLLLLVAGAWAQASALDVLRLDDDSAAGLGMDLLRRRLLLLVTASGLVAVCVAVTGALPFVGLLAPHIARWGFGPSHRALIPAAALCGAVLTVVADGAGRSLPGRAEIPAGTAIGVLGGAYFLIRLVIPSRERSGP